MARRLTRGLLSSQVRKKMCCVIVTLIVILIIVLIPIITARSGDS